MAMKDKQSDPPPGKKLPRIVLVGSPNVGKSVLFNALSRQYVVVSNYPGTSVEVTRGTGQIGGTSVEILDTPGMYSLIPITEEERVARRILMQERPDVVVHVVDARNLERMLPLTLQLLDAGLPVVLALNMMDEADRDHVRIDVAALARELNIPVIPTAATSGRGLDDLRRILLVDRPIRDPSPRLTFAADAETALAGIQDQLPAGYATHFSRRFLALLLLCDDEEIRDAVESQLGADRTAGLRQSLQAFATAGRESFVYRLLQRQREIARELLAPLIQQDEVALSFRERLSRLMLHPVTGIPILFLVLYFGLYQFVGGFGAGVAVDYLEHHLFDQHITPWLEQLARTWLPWPVLQSLFVGEFGLFTLGLRYALAIILPIVTFFFLVFSVIEDSGYLPRLASLIDRVFKGIGLSGRAVIPMVLGLGCATMATMVTRTLPTRRERVLATLLLAVAVPCSAQLGVIMALLAGRPRVAAVWGILVVLVFLLVGWLGARFMPGSPASFYMELPPLRIPSLANVLIKTYVRVKWYLVEVLPLFLVASVLIWLGKLTGLFDRLVAALTVPMHAMGLPDSCAPVFLFGFFRRDYGAAGLYDLNQQHLLTNNQIAVAAVALTLFLPCIAQFLMNIKERGWKTGVTISVLTLMIAFVVSWALNQVLSGFRVTL